MRPWLERHRDLLTATLALALAVALILLVLEWRRGPEPLEIHLAEPSEDGSGFEVYVAGAVQRPGVYALHDGARVVDALAAAGGAAADADLEAVNLARRLHDEDQVLVPRLGEASSSVAGASSAALININTAREALLDTLPGIGETYARRIVESRTNDGPFASVEDLLEREIIPRATFERIRDLITVR